MTIPPAAGPKAPPSASADSKPPGNRRTLFGATILIWAVTAGLGILFSVFAVAIGLQAATFDVMRWLLALAIEAPLAAGIIALIWYSRNMHSATAAGEAGAQALAHSEAKYQELIASAPDGIFVLDPQAKVIDVNGAGEELFGLRERKSSATRSWNSSRPNGWSPHARTSPIGSRACGPRSSTRPRLPRGT